MISRHTDDHALEVRLAARLAGGLTARSQQLPADVTERLRFARERALERSREVRAAAPAAVGIVSVGHRGAATLGRFVPWWLRAASVLPLVVLVAGLVVIDRWSVREQVLTAAEIDVLLLSDDLPPSAYSDPGFAEYLRTAPPSTP
jgi:hypothetical protein